MREMIMGQIDLGNFDLRDMLNRINYYHVAGELTDAEREELVQRAQQKAVAALEVDPKTEILALWEAVHALEARLDAVQTGTAEPGHIETPVDNYPEYVQPTGAHDAYNTGDKVTYNGKHYESLINANVWDPGVYPQGWQEVE